MNPQPLSIKTSGTQGYAYETPRLRRLGSIRELTRNVGNFGAPDGGAFPPGTRLRTFEYDDEQFFDPGA